MKANELMVGNIVRYDGMTVYIGQVNKTKIRGMIDKNDLMADIGFRMELLEPIPITEELLLKNGFTYRKDRYRGRDLHIYMKKVYGQFVIECSEGFSGDGQYLSNVYELERKEERAHTWGNVKHLHQLQNLCNIAGVEMEWKV